jgi:hypothetical protein
MQAIIGDRGDVYQGRQGLPDEEILVLPARPLAAAVEEDDERAVVGRPVRHVEVEPPALARAVGEVAADAAALARGERVEEAGARAGLERDDRQEDMKGA